MSLYREAGASSWRRLALVGVIALIVGLGAGFGIGRGSAPEPTADDIVAQLSEDFAPVASGLELIPTEYGDVEAGEGGESAAVTGDLGKIRSGLNAARADATTLDPDGFSALEDAVKDLETAVDQKVSGDEIGQLVDAAKAKLAALPGGA